MGERRNGLRIVGRVLMALSVVSLVNTTRRLDNVQSVYWCANIILAAILMESKPTPTRSEEE